MMITTLCAMSNFQNQLMFASYQKCNLQMIYTNDLFPLNDMSELVCNKSIKMITY